MAGQLNVELVVPDRRVWSGPAEMVVARTSEGDIGILPGHEPVLGLLVSGQVSVHQSDGDVLTAAVHGGFLSVADDNVSILAEVAELAAEIDVQRAEAALRREAEKEEEVEEARRRAEVRLRVAGAR
ncbi:MAG: F0F1 ATP synthase subunit epsilon [Actinomycetota bacterium]